MGTNLSRRDFLGTVGKAGLGALVFGTQACGAIKRTVFPRDYNVASDFGPDLKNAKAVVFFAEGYELVQRGDKQVRRYINMNAKEYNSDRPAFAYITHNINAGDKLRYQIRGPTDKEIANVEEKINSSGTKTVEINLKSIPLKGVRTTFTVRVYRPIWKGLRTKTISANEVTYLKKQ